MWGQLKYDDIEDQESSDEQMSEQEDYPDLIGEGEEEEEQDFHNVEPVPEVNILDQVNLEHKGVDIRKQVDDLDDIDGGIDEHGNEKKLYQVLPEAAPG